MQRKMDHGGTWTPMVKGIYIYKLGNDFDSISMSCHKWHGGKIAGVSIVHKEHIDKTNNNIEYVNLNDRMISGSRCGDAPLIWLTRLEQFDWEYEFLECIKNAKYLYKELVLMDIRVSLQYMTLVFDAPTDKIIPKYELMRVGNKCHAIILPHVTKDLIDEFLTDVNRYLHISNQKYTCNNDLLISLYLDIENVS